MSDRTTPRLKRQKKRPSLRDRALRKKEPAEAPARLRFGTGHDPMRMRPGEQPPRRSSRRALQKRLRRIQQQRLGPGRRFPGDEEDPDVKQRIRRQYQRDLMASNAAEDARRAARGIRREEPLPGRKDPETTARQTGSQRVTTTNIKDTGGGSPTPDRIRNDPSHAAGEQFPAGTPGAFPGEETKTGPVSDPEGMFLPVPGKRETRTRDLPSETPATVQRPRDHRVPRPSEKLRHTVEAAAVAKFREEQDDNDAVKASQRAADEGRSAISRAARQNSVRRQRLREQSRRAQSIQTARTETEREARHAFQKRRQKRANAAAYRARSFGRGGALAEEPVPGGGGSLLRRIFPGSSDGMSRLFRWMLLILLLILVMTMLASGMLLSVSSGHGVVLTTYPNSDEDIYETENAYRRLEQALEAELTTISIRYPGYQEYNMDIDGIGHDPYVLISYLNTYHWNFTPEDVEEELQALFDAQYELTVTPGTRVRNGETIRVLNVRLRNRGLDTVVQERMDDEQRELYDALMITKGNRDYLFNASNSAFYGDAGMNYRVPEEALSDEQFARMLREAEKYLGWPYVWGGSSPADGGFDCSGYVCWVVNHCGNGWNVGRTTAEGLRRLCAYVKPSEAKPGDLVFFQGTYNTEGASHVGIYVGNGMMINAGDPIKYASINTPYWQQHFMQFGRLPGANPGTSSGTSSSGFTEEDRRLLADCIYWEARGQSFECQCYVGQVILNRVYDRRYPNTIRGVIGQPGQYANGIRSSPDPCYAAADAVLSGQVAMPRNVIYQAQFTQGSGVWKYLEGEYFCYG